MLKVSFQSPSKASSVNPIRFSTKYQDAETDSVHYGYRFEKDRRWLSRDSMAMPASPEVLIAGKETGIIKINNPVVFFREVYK
jgi:hypothetical protein